MRNRKGTNHLIKLAEKIKKFLVAGCLVLGDEVKEEDPFGADRAECYRLVAELFFLNVEKRVLLF